MQGKRSQKQTKLKKTYNTKVQKQTQKIVSKSKTKAHENKRNKDSEII